MILYEANIQNLLSPFLCDIFVCSKIFKKGKNVFQMLFKDLLLRKKMLIEFGFQLISTSCEI